MRRIIIVDDHPIVRDGLAQLIAEKSGGHFEVASTVGSVTEALPLIKRLTPDLVIVDIALDGQDGIDGLDTACPSQEMADHRFGRADGQLVGMVTINHPKLVSILRDL